MLTVCKNKIGILENSSRVSVTIWLHHLDSNGKKEKNGRWVILKDNACCFEQILEAAIFKFATF